MNKFNYYFKVRPTKDVALNLGVIYKDLGYIRIDKNKISQIYNITKEDIDNTYYLNKFEQKIDIANINNGKLHIMCEQLTEKWNEYRDEYFEIISNIFNIDFNGEETNHIYCYLQLLPINQVDLRDNIIYLDCNKSVDEVFKNFIIMLTKALLVARWNSVNNWELNIKFDAKNKVWMFIEFAIDAIFKNSELSKICTQPSYQYFYSLKFEDENAMICFNNLYKTLPLDKFFTKVYMSIHTNYQTLLPFKNYLY